MANFKTREVVLGVQKSKGQMDNGTAFDSSKVNVLTDLRESSGVGFASVTYNWGTSENYERLLREGHNVFPAVCDVEFEMLARGNDKSQIVIKNLAYVSPVNVQAVGGADKKAA